MFALYFVNVFKMKKKNRGRKKRVVSLSCLVKMTGEYMCKAHLSLKVKVESNLCIYLYI